MRKASSRPPFEASKETPRARYDGGTIVLDNMAQNIKVPAQFKWHLGKWRCRAVDYRLIYPWLQEQSIRNNIPRWQNCP